MKKSDPSHNESEIGFIGSWLDRTTRSIIDKGARILVNVINDPNSKIIGHIGTGLTLTGEALKNFGAALHEQQNLKNEQKALADQKEKELHEKEAHIKDLNEKFTQFYDFLVTVDKELHSTKEGVNNFLPQQYDSSNFSPLNGQLLTKGEQDHLKAMQEKLEKDKKERSAIIDNYIYKQSTNNENKTTIKYNGPDVRKWWIDKKFPTDEKGHPDLRWIENELGKMHLLKKYLSGSNLYACNLSGMDLTEFDLSYATLHSAQLNKCCLKQTNFTSANISHAYLVEAEFAFTVLVNANLTGAALQGSKLTKAMLLNCNFERTNITGIVIIEVLSVAQTQQTEYSVELIKHLKELGVKGNPLYIRTEKSIWEQAIMNISDTLQQNKDNDEKIDKLVDDFSPLVDLDLTAVKPNDGKVLALGSHLQNYLNEQSSKTSINVTK